MLTFAFICYDDDFTSDGGPVLLSQSSEALLQNCIKTRPVRFFKEEVNLSLMDKFSVLYGAPPAVRGGVSMRVLWRISGYKIGENAVWGEEEARKLLFKPLDIDADKITFDGQTCGDVVFKKEMVSAKEYLQNVYHTTPQALGIKQEVVEVVKTNCDLPGFAEYLRLRDRGLIIHLKGVFFYFEPAVH